LWANDETGMEIFRSTMSLQSFRFLLQCLRFDDGTTMAARSEVDILAPIRQFFELFFTKCKSHYSVGELVTIDEKLEKFRGNCPFRQYIESSTGLKFMPLWISEPSTHKTWKFMRGNNLKDHTKSVIHQLTL
jgi:hypothetical protein